MKNWIIVLLIFIMPLGIYSFLDARAQNDAMCKIAGANTGVPKAKLIKFSSPMCSECKEVAEELKKVDGDLKSAIIVEEINVIDTNKAASKYNKKLIEKYNVTLVPTLVFLDKENNIVKRHEGVLKADEIKRVIGEIK